VEQQAAAADTALRIAENQMQAFLQRNRSIAGSPELTLEQDRLQRAVILRQTILTTLLQRREEARVKEVRDTPVITVVESPQLPVTGEPRRSAMKAIIGSLIAAGFGLVLALTLEALSADRRRFPGASMRWLRVLRTVARDPFGSLT
jgi:uncharacterized protein involved in exopolysaccharide biosynthesis